MTSTGVVYRDARGVEYESVPLPTHEVTDAVPLSARLVSKRAVKRQQPKYDGNDGVELARQPRGHRQHWTDEQWVAFEEYRQRETEQAVKDLPVATAVIVKPHY